MPHLLLSVTAHGYGHFAQAGTIAAALALELTGLEITVQADLPERIIDERVPGCRVVPLAPDVGMRMDGPLRVDWRASMNAYRDYHVEYDRHLLAQRELMKRLRPDLVLADVPWLPLEVAAEYGVPAVALCSLNWVDVLSASPVADAFPTDLAERMRAGYSTAEVFLRPAPSMPMHWLSNGLDIGPIAMRGESRRLALLRDIGCRSSDRLVLVDLGGVAPAMGSLCLPRLKGVHWLVNEGAAPPRGDCTPLSGLGGRFVDLLASCDLMVTKPGYGMFAEAACHGLPVLYVPRLDWPEEPYLVDWLSARVPTRELSGARFLSGEWAEEVLELLAMMRPPPQSPTGVTEAAAVLRGYLV